MEPAALRIGEVAKGSGLSVKTIRFYCEENLIQPAARTVGGFRLFREDVFDELVLIRTLKAMEIPLGDVRRILEARRMGMCTCTSLQTMIRTKAGEIEQKIWALKSLYETLNNLLETWEDCGGRKSTEA